MPRLRHRRAGLALWQIEHDSPSIIAVDTETTGLEFYDEPFAATLSWRSPEGELRNALEKVPAWVFHNAKFDLQKLKLIGVIDDALIERVDLHDTQSLYTLLDENDRKGLKYLAVKILKYDDTIKVPYKTKGRENEFREISREKYELDEARRKLKLTKDDGYHLLPRRIIVPYALRDTDFTLQLYEKLMPALERKGDPDLLTAYAKAMRLKRVFLRMEAVGMAVDVPYLEAKASEYGVKVMEGWNRVVELTGNPRLNPNAPAQVMAELNKRGLYPEDTQRGTLEKLGDDDFVSALLQYRADTKIHKTYLVGLLNAQRNGRVHPHFNDDGARTGRTSSGAAKE
jgi:DNA polymerase I-like protein with 3'-5' exonuclease and polymerase domains